MNLLWSGVLVLFFSLLGLFIGFLLALRPHLAIEIQRKFYAKINWKIEPISMSREIRNTKAMGWFLIMLVIATLIIILTKKPAC